MMNFKEYTEAVLAEIQKKADGTFDILLNTVTKNNGVKLTGISVMAQGSNSGPCVYLDELYREYENGGMEFGEVVDDIYRLITKYLNDMPDIDMFDFRNWETVKRNVYAKLVNAEQNKELLEKTPHRLFLDLAVVYYGVVRGKGQEIGTFLIHNEHMESWEQEEEVLYQTAMENMRAEGEANFASMETVLKENFPDADIPLNFKENDVSMYILTNDRKMYGASELLDKATLQMIADEVGDGFIVLPSSIHETIVMRPCMSSEYESLADMVREVNDTQVDIEERLSYHVYTYSRDEGALQIVA